ncbi:uncharacterized protein LOC101845637 isoform X2 [Aplysia californica]|uniref:Uncharacterized protein LOC101845637 isoform X2 n=1 Tax=Aplysia californica TaxID=6500 RepID=A0ABM0JZH4_APLCA|nr:uncharacterized protein LOC101845637 isoform X2 [Aplysia californica]
MAQEREAGFFRLDTEAPRQHMGDLEAGGTECHSTGFCSRSTDVRGKHPETELNSEERAVVEQLHEPLRSNSGFSYVSLVPPSYVDSLETEVKTLVSLDQNSPGVDVVEDEKNEEFSASEKEELLQSIRQLKKEQEHLKAVQEAQQQEQVRLRQLQEEHDTHLKKLIESQPRISRRVQTLRKTKAVGLAAIACQTIANSRDVGPNERVKSMSTNHLYVQIEELYANFHRLNWISKMQEPEPEEDPYDQVLNYPSHDELKEENDLLKNKVKALEQKLNSNDGKSSQAALQIKPAQPESHLCSSSPVLPPGPHGKDSIVAAPVPLKRRPPSLVAVEATFEWTISDYKAKLKNEKMNRGSKEVSRLFYITHQGYRCQLEAYLNGNGTGYGTCMSVFLRVVKGEHDDRLKWPVDLTLVIIVVNQTDDNSDSLKPSAPVRNKFRYNRPTSTNEDGTDCWGLIEYVSHDLMKQRSYIKNDAIILKCRILHK